MDTQVNQELKEYIETKIFPVYESFDKDYIENYIKIFINRTLKVAKTIDNINLDIAYTAAALHDIGILIEKNKHAFYSGVFVSNHAALKKFFNEGQIIIIKEAVEDHSLSVNIEPRNIYGKMLSDISKEYITEKKKIYKK